MGPAAWNVAGIPVGRLAVMVISNRYIRDPTRWSEVASSRVPAMRMGDAIDCPRAVSDRVIAVEIRVVVGAPAVVEVAVAVGIVAPARVARADEN